MSVVAAKVSKNKIEIASDAILVYDYTKHKSVNSFSKLFKENDIIIGSCGIAEESSLLQIFIKNRKPTSFSVDGVTEFFVEFSEWKSKKTDNYSSENQYLLVGDQKLFCIEGLFVQEINSFIAIGIGADYALAALHLGKSPKEACEVACELCCFCCEPIKVMKVKIDGL